MQSIAIVQSFHPDTHGDERSTRAHNRQYSVSDPETRRPLGWCTIFPSAGSPARSRQFQIYSTLPLRSPIPEGSGCLPDTRPSENDWNVMRPTIKRLYCRHEQRLEDVVEIMKLVYGFSASQNMFDRRIRGWGYKVNHAKDKSNGDATGARTSNRKRKPKGSGDRQARSGMLGTPNETKFSDRDDLQTIPVIQSPDAYLLQEQMLSSVHNYALGVFQSRKWKFDPLRTYAPQGSQDFGAIWKDLSDQCFGAGILSRNHGQRREAIMKLQCILEGIEAVGNASDPHLLVRFWRLCRYLHGINLSTENEPSQPRGQILRLFITRFRDLARLNSGEQSPLYLLLDAFSKMDFEDAIWGLRIGHLRAIQTLQSIIGERHPMVLSMRVYYMKQWRIKDGRHHDMLVDHHLQTLRAAETTLGTSSDEAISILHDLTYYAYYSLQDDADMKTDKVLAFAIELRRRAGARLHGPCRWNMLTQYYTFATQILATMASAQNDLVQAESYIREAVARFHNGDVECQTRASMLLGKYERWIRDKNGPVWEVMRARETIQQLQSSLTNALSGKTRGH